MSPKSLFKYQHAYACLAHGLCCSGFAFVCVSEEIISSCDKCMGRKKPFSGRTDSFEMTCHFLQTKTNLKKMYNLANHCINADRHRENMSDISISMSNNTTGMDPEDSINSIIYSQCHQEIRQVKENESAGCGLETKGSEISVNITQPTHPL